MINHHKNLEASKTTQATRPNHRVHPKQVKTTTAASFETAVAFITNELLRS